MRHAVGGYKLSRDSEHRKALFRNLAAALFQHGQITTTLPKARAVRPFVEKLITLARKGDLASRRRAIALLQDRFLVNIVKGYDDDQNVVRDSRYRVVSAPRLIDKLFREIGPQFADRAGGYTRIVKLSNAHRLQGAAVSGFRVGDGGSLVVLQLVGQEQAGAPRVKGRYSRRRQKQDNRTTFAAQLRKAARGEGESPTTAETTAPETPQGEQPQAEGN